MYIYSYFFNLQIHWFINVMSLHSSQSITTSFNTLQDPLSKVYMICFIENCLGLPFLGLLQIFSSIIDVTDALFCRRCPIHYFLLSLIVVHIDLLPCILWYNSMESWTTLKSDRRRIKAFETWCWRKVLKMSQTE